MLKNTAVKTPFAWTTLIVVLSILGMIIAGNFLIEMRPQQLTGIPLAPLLLLAFVLFFRFRGIEDREWGKFLLPLFGAALLPDFIATLDYRFSLGLFGVSCPDPFLRDYAFLVLDSLAKGVLLDFMESYNLHVYTCAPSSSFTASTVIFAIRCYSTFILAWSILSVYRLWRKSRDSGYHPSK